MLKKIPVLLFCSLFVFTSCKTGSSYEPVVENPGANYQNDLTRCQRLSEQRKYLNGDNGVNAASGAGAGGIAGLLLGGGVNNALVGAVIGGAFGGGSGMVNTKDEKKYIIVQCLKCMGHDVYL